MGQTDAETGLTMWGDPASEMGALMVMDSIQGVTQARVEIVKAQLRRHGLPITAKIEADLERMRSEYEEGLMHELQGRGVPDSFKALFRAASKKEVQRLARHLTLTGADLADLVMNCGDLGLSHRVKHPQFVPEHLRATSEENAAMRSAVPGKLQGDALTFVRKLSAGFRERKVWNAHLFEAVDEWHCVWFSYSDAYSDGIPGAKNHWRHGEHIHYVCHHWPGLDPDELWNRFDARKVDSLPSVHIRFSRERP